MKISELVKKYRADKDMSLRDFAQKCGMSHTTINFIEKEKNPSTGRPMELSPATYKKLAAAMDMTMQELFEQLDDVDAEMFLSYSEEEQLLISAWRAADSIDREMARRALHIES